MNGTEVWKRLWWKEWRESRFALLIALFGPLPVLSIGSTWKRAEDVAQFFAACGFLTLINVWAAGKASRERQTNEFARTHLPATQLSEWLVSCLAPTLVALVVGAWYAAWHCAALDAWHAAYRSSVSSWDQSTAIPVWALATAAIFAASYLLSRTVSYWFAVAVGVIGSVFVFLIADIVLPQHSRDRVADLAVAWLARLFALCLAGASAGSFFFAAVSGKLPARAAQVAAIGIALAIAVGPHVKTMATEVWHPDRVYDWAYTKTVSSPDRSLVVETERVVDTSPLKPTVTKVRFRDYRRDFKTQLEMSAVALALGFRGRGEVVLAAQSPEERIVRIMVWDTATGRMKNAAAIPTRRDALADIARQSDPQPIFSVSPDGALALVDLRALRGNGTDLWLVDLLTGRSRIVLPNRAYGWASEQVDWGNGRAVVSGSGRALTIDLDSAKMAEIEIPWKSGGER